MVEESIKQYQNFVQKPGQRQIHFTKISTI